MLRLEAAAATATAAATRCSVLPPGALPRPGARLEDDARDSCARLGEARVLCALGLQELVPLAQVKGEAALARHSDGWWRLPGLLAGLAGAAGVAVWRRSAGTEQPAAGRGWGAVISDGRASGGAIGPAAPPASLGRRQVDGRLSSRALPRRHRRSEHRDRSCTHIGAPAAPASPPSSALPPLEPPARPPAPPQPPGSYSHTQQQQP